MLVAVAAITVWRERLGTIYRVGQPTSARCFVIKCLRVSIVIRLEQVVGLALQSGRWRTDCARLFLEGGLIGSGVGLLLLLILVTSMSVAPIKHLFTFS